MALKCLNNFFRLQIPYVDTIILRTTDYPLKYFTIQAISVSFSFNENYQMISYCSNFSYLLKFRYHSKRKQTPQTRTNKKTELPCHQWQKNLQRCSTFHSYVQYKSSDICLCWNPKVSVCWIRISCLYFTK